MENVVAFLQGVLNKVVVTINGGNVKVWQLLVGLLTMDWLC